MPKELTPEEASTRRTYDRHAESYVRAWSRPDGKPRRLSSEDDCKFRELLPAGRILEIGAGGSGQTASWFVHHGYDYVGTDISSGMLELARKNCPEARFEQISVYDLDFDEPFDGFWCSSTLLHIPKDRLDEALNAIRQNMKLSAAGFISIKRGAGETMEADGRFHAYWSDEDFSGRLKANGYSILERNDFLSQNISWLSYLVRTER